MIRICRPTHCIMSPKAPELEGLGIVKSVLSVWASMPKHLPAHKNSMAVKRSSQSADPAQSVSENHIGTCCQTCYQYTALCSADSVMSRHELMPPTQKGSSLQDHGQQT